MSIIVVRNLWKEERGGNISLNTIVYPCLEYRHRLEFLSGELRKRWLAEHVSLPLNLLGVKAIHCTRQSSPSGGGLNRALSTKKRSCLYLHIRGI